MKIFVGDDIVDLKSLDLEEKHKNTRFLERVLSAKEQVLFNQAKNQKEMLWIFWSGKESAYKVLKKKKPDLVFAHSKFEVSFDQDTNSGLARFEDDLVSLRWNRSPNWIHCLALLKKDEKHLNVFDYDIKELEQVSLSTEEFDLRELASTYSSESAGVRNLAKALLAKHMLEGARIIRQPLKKKFAPPELYLSEIPLKKWDISMSHDGRFVSCAVTHGDSL